MSPAVYQWAARHGVTLAALNELQALFGMHGGHDLPATVKGTSEPLLKRIEELESDPAIHFAHRFAVVLECMVHSEYPNDYWTEATTLLSEYHEAQDKWREMMGEPYVSGFGKD